MTTPSPDNPVPVHIRWDRRREITIEPASTLDLHFCIDQLVADPKFSHINIEMGNQE